MGLRTVLGVSLSLNLLLAAVVAWKLGGAGPRPRPATPAASEPAAVQLAEAPAPPVDYVKSRFAAIEPALRYRGETGAAFPRWQSRARDAFKQVLRVGAEPFGGEVRVTERTPFPTFTREKLYLRIERDLWLPAYLLVPRGAVGRPAVIAMPGHDMFKFRGARAIAGQDTPDNYMRAFGVRLAEAGYVVLAIDVAGIGELRMMDYLAVSELGLSRGQPHKGMMLDEVRQATDYLASRPEVAPDRLGAMGVSLGGELAMFAAALDPRIRYVVSSGFFGSYRDLGAGLMVSHYVPGLLQQLDLPDLAALVAPRPMLLQVGEADVIIARGNPKAHFPPVARAYAASGAAQAVRFETHPGGHVLDVAPALAWLKRVMPVSAALPAAQVAPEAEPQ